MTLADRVFDSSAEAIMITDARNRIVRVNPAFERITGYSAREAVGSTPTFLSSGRHSKRFYADLWFALKTQGRWQGEIWNRRKSGEVYPEWVSISLLRNRAGAVTHHAAFFSDITAQKNSEAHLNWLAHHDALTGLPNRVVMHDRLNQALAYAKAKAGLAAVLLIDLDQFKAVNDTLGHSAGDHVLVAAAERMAACLHRDAVLCRHGGDEFVAILPDMTSPESAHAVVRRLMDEMARPFAIPAGRALIGASIGCAVYPFNGETAEALLEAADIAMYKGKIPYARSA